MRSGPKVIFRQLSLQPVVHGYLPLTTAPLHNMRMKNIRPNHMEGCIKDADVGQSTKQRMKSLYNMMYRYAMKMEKGNASVQYGTPTSRYQAHIHYPLQGTQHG